MIRYKIVGILIMLSGFLEVSCFLLISIFIVPMLNGRYSGPGIEKPSFVLIYLILGVVILTGIGNLFFGFNLIRKSEKKYLKYALILLTVSLFLGLNAYIAGLYKILSPPITCEKGWKEGLAPWTLSTICYKPSGQDGNLCDKRGDCGGGTCVLEGYKGVCRDQFFCGSFLDEEGKINHLCI